MEAHPETEKDAQPHPGLTRLDIRDIACRWNPKVARLIPGFIYNKLSRILHIQELNEMLEDTQHDTPQAFLSKCVKAFDLKVRIVGREKIEAQRRNDNLFIVANHPIGGPEGLSLMEEVLPILPKAKIMVQNMLSVLKPMQEIAVYNGKRLMTTLASVKNGDPVIIFPAGFCSRRLDNKEIFDPEWKATFVKLAQRYSRTILPIYISGRLGERIYRWYTLRKRLHINLSVETLYLVDEMFRCKGRELVFTVGNPIAPEILTNDVPPEEWAARIRQYVHQLQFDQEAVFDPLLPDTLCPR